jgi:putative membrane protein
MKNFTLPLLPVLLTAGISFAATTKMPISMPDKMNDEQLSKVLTTVNDGEIALANQVLSETKNEEVKKFAQHMVNDHQMNNSSTRDIIAKEKIAPMESVKSNELKMKAETSRTKLMALSGKDLDKAYIDDQVKTHQLVLDNLNNKMIPAAKDNMLKAHLEKTAKKVEEHLNHAKELQSHML